MQLDISDLSVGYGSHAVLEKLSVSTLYGGHVVGLLGANGSGKSTLLRTLAGIIGARSGHTVFKVEDEAVSGRKRRHLTGYVPQELPDGAALTAFETVLVSARRYLGNEAQASKKAAQVMVDLAIDHLGQKYLNQLSGGQRQMVATAQVLVQSPKLLLLDEPTSALDLSRQLFLLDKIRDHTREQQSLAICAIHDLNLAARFCDVLLCLKDGAIIAQGPARGESSIMTSEMLRELFNVEAAVIDVQGVPVVAPYGYC